MRPDIAISSPLLGAVLLTALAWKWGIKLRTGLIGGVVIGIVTGIATTLIASKYSHFSTLVTLGIEVVLILGITALAILVRFSRDPERHAEETQNVILAPADGKIVYVSKMEDTSSLVSVKHGRKFKLHEITSAKLFSGGAYLIGIDMNVLNVHVNRSPIAGRAILLKRTPGIFMSLRKPEAETTNERVTTVIENETLSVAVVQIASRLVRRIVSYVGEGDSLEIGQRIGAIVFGSQVDIVIPNLHNLEVTVDPDQEVLAGITVIARLRSRGDTSRELPNSRRRNASRRTGRP